VKIFISYSRLDASETANTIHSYLKESGHEVFIDTSSIHGGDEWRNTIQEHISECDIFVLIVSRSAYRRPEVKRELELADSMKKRIIPCVNKKYVNYEDLHDNIKKYNGINYESRDDLIQELDYKIEVKIKELEKIGSKVKTGSMPADSKPLSYFNLDEKLVGEPLSKELIENFNQSTEKTPKKKGFFGFRKKGYHNIRDLK